MLLTRYGFGFNTDLFETNILNLTVVVVIVVIFVGDALSSLLNQRRIMILSTLQEADQKAKAAKRQLEVAEKNVELAVVRAKEIREQGVQSAEKEELMRQKRFEEDIASLRRRMAQRIQLQRQQRIYRVVEQIVDLALIRTKDKLLRTLGPGSGSKQKDLNEICVHETFLQLKR